MLRMKTQGYKFSHIEIVKSMNIPIELIESPSILGLRPTGVEQLPESLIDAGLLKLLQIEQSKAVPPLPYNSDRDPKTLMLNSEAIASYSLMLAGVVQETIRKGAFPLVLGGDCSIILGNMLALKRQGRYGLFYLDGHADFYQPQASPTGEAADMALALVCGRGPDIVTNLDGQRPLVKEEDTVLFGQRDREETIEYGSRQVLDRPIHVFELEDIKRNGLVDSANDALAQLLDDQIEGFWIHMDVDVLDDEIMPAVDYRMPGGLSFEDLSNILNILLSSGKAAGMDIGIFNPRLDPDGEAASKLAASISNGFNRPQARHKRKST